MLFTDPHHTNAATNTNDVTDTNVHPSPGHALVCEAQQQLPRSDFFRPGQFCREDFLSCVSSYSDNLAETQNFESSILGFEKSSDSSVVRKPSESEDDVTDRSIDLDLGQCGLNML
ncbi:hypothetical protein KUCAC02_025875 [Chaenocephalus aceratus]|uniref:Uncharacterized protein n=1 Tax=Chaenocephalus aceratus TaxID=36190 RepID=A0ACB9VVR3_CHAAC|nr:hypothetical protein KUCAC02_025875 [Chaenocephalus aceratus]